MLRMFLAALILLLSLVSHPTDEDTCIWEVMR
jgi:hypothetical protein